ncbi:HU domain-containing protein [Parvicella tangerina]|uniref:SPOR domain-containing protein n=1 Tax=Parvicella tangerina TaxID=2829795 RepID=A0A916NJ78_9FLAO|nr:SPOR domain-containing protein [Parvicella tangerina]CAG5086420.1 hypothetical protein CRYO30217_03115 [Parvicella tangerina]
MPSAIEKHIIDLLHQHDCVIIPELGGLVANYTPAFADAKGNALCPPKKEFIWNRFLLHNDGLLANEIAKKEDVSYDEAVTQIADYVSVIKSSLKESKRFEFGQIGFLYVGNKGQTQFEYSGRNFLMNSFGLPLVKLEKLPVVQESLEEDVVEEKVAKVIQLEPEVDKTEEEESKVIPIASPETIEKVIVKGSKWWIAAALIPIGFYSAWIPMKTDLFKGGDNFHYSDLNPFTYDKEKGNYEMVSNLALKIDTLPPVSFEPLDAYSNRTSDVIHEENTVLSPESTYVDNEVSELEHNEVDIHLGNYFVIGGCFSNEANAEEFVKQLKEAGYDALLVDQNKGLHRVAFGQYASKEAAKVAHKEITSIGEYSAWVLKK